MAKSKRGWKGEPKRHQLVKVKSLGFRSVASWKKQLLKTHKPNLKLDRMKKAKNTRSRFQPNWRGDLKGKKV